MCISTLRGLNYYGLLTADVSSGRMIPSLYIVIVVQVISPVRCVAFIKCNGKDGPLRANKFHRNGPVITAQEHLLDLQQPPTNSHYCYYYDCYYYCASLFPCYLRARPALYCQRPCWFPYIHTVDPCIHWEQVSYS